jgi:hypothetical protein
VTWEKNLPHGCRAMKFKSKELPCLHVFKNSGIACLMFSPKEAPKDKEQTGK